MRFRENSTYGITVTEGGTVVFRCEYRIILSLISRENVKKLDHRKKPDGTFH